MQEDQSIPTDLDDVEDTTHYLLASPPNAERLRLAYEQFDRGERVDFTLPAE